jgi:hypothetical protein
MLHDAVRDIWIPAFAGLTIHGGEQSAQTETIFLQPVICASLTLPLDRFFEAVKLLRR